MPASWLLPLTLGLLNVDMGQTMNAMDMGMRETNPVLGDHPAPEETMRYFGAWNEAAKKMDWKSLLGLAAVEGASIGLNASRGVKPIPAAVVTIPW